LGQARLQALFAIKIALNGDEKLHGRVAEVGDGFVVAEKRDGDPLYPSVVLFHEAVAE
jgi:hypothetical protein